ncbi:Peptidyl-prolyl cis-trans isomerase FKBP65 [Diplonema papillatum]|nr:Peptidyl-prolyl cis-trans isomerase FKBP65 [Diplonema papillatum]
MSGGAPSIGQHLDNARRSKDAGNAKLKEGNYKGASFQYKQGLLYVKACLPDGGSSEVKMFAKPPKTTDAEAAEAASLASVLNSNIAQAKLKLEDWDAVVKHAGEAITMDPANTKAYYRRGKAQLKLGKLENAEADFKQVAKVDAKLVEAEMKQLAAENTRQKKQSDQLFKKMMGSGS